MNKYSVFLLPVAMTLLLSNNYQQKKKNHTAVHAGTAQWTGTLTLDEKFTGITGTSERHISVSFINALPTLYRDDGISDLNFTDDKGIGTATYHGEAIIEGKKMGVTDCRGSGPSELHAVVVDEEASTYFIEAIGPECNGTDVSYIDNRTTPYGPETTSIITSDQPLTNKNVLAGSKTEVLDMGGDLGKITRIIGWHLERVTNNNAELIVTPEDYDNWLPEPGRDELFKGTVMKVNLKVKNTNGKPLTVKAKTFELTLSNTSVEPGITVNYPVSPRAKQLPDLRFLVLGMGESISEDQFLSIPCTDGVSGKVSIASYDGGGRTILTVVAILKDDTRIKGHLLVSGGEEEIRIPKRAIGSIIATKWLNDNGNPGAMDDIEETDENHNKGDGLTAYEEYRGVVSMDTFRRLSPKKKELGILVKQSEYNLFKEGFLRFQNASDIRILVFGRNEIPDNRRLNRNALSAHDFNQSVLRLSKGNTDQPELDLTIKKAWGLCFPTNDIPARVTHIVIDVDRIHRWYQAAVQSLGAANLPFTVNDLVASTTAHEIGHGTSLPHHGSPKKPLPSIRVETNPPRIINANTSTSWEVTDRPFPVEAPIGLPGNHETGNVSCFMCYRNKSSWVRVTETNNTVAYYRVPLLAAGTIFCIEKKGTGINKDNEYFGNAINGECLGHIKLRD